MRRRELIVGATATAAALAGCVGSAQEDDSSGSDDPRTITVSGSGEIEAEPDRATVQVGVEASGDSADAVRDDLSTRIQTVKEALLSYGLEEDDVTTGRFSIRERDERRAADGDTEGGSGEPTEEQRYYEGTHSLTVNLEDVEAAGEVIDTAVDAGADEVGRVEFDLSEGTREELREAALEEAIGNARSEAEVVAGEVGTSIVEARTIDTSGSSVEPVRADVAMESGDAGAPTELHPDDVTVGATVTVTYEME